MITRTFLELAWKAQANHIKTISSGRYLIEFALRMYQLKRQMNQPFEIFLENEWKLNLKSKQLAVEIKESAHIDIPLYKKIKTGIDISVPKSFPC